MILLEFVFISHIQIIGNKPAAYAYAPTKGGGKLKPCLRKTYNFGEFHLRDTVTPLFTFFYFAGWYD